MSETISNQASPEERVFGDAFTFANGEADVEVQELFFIARVRKISEGGEGWLPNALDTDTAVSAHYYKGNRIVATLVHDYDTKLSDVYVTSAGGEFGDTTLAEQVAFDEAVVSAEEYAQTV